MGNNNLITIEFHGHNLETFQEGGTEWVSVRSIASSIGLHVESQQRKLLKNQEKFSCSLKGVTASDGKTYSTYCIPVEKVPGWLFTVNPDRVKPEAKEQVKLFQEECFDVLHDYWHSKSQPEPAEHEPRALPDGTTRHVWMTVNSSGRVLEQIDLTTPEVVSDQVSRHFDSLFILPKERVGELVETATDRAMQAGAAVMHLLSPLKFRSAIDDNKMALQADVCADKVLS